MIRASSIVLLVYTMAAAFAFTLPAHLAPRSTIIISMSSKWNPGQKPAIGDQSNGFTFNGDSGIGAGQSAMATKRRPAITSTPRGRFTYEGESSIGGGHSAIISKKHRANSMAEPTWAQPYLEPGVAEPVRRKKLTGEGAQRQVATAGRKNAQAAISTESRNTRIARGRTLLQSAIDERFNVLLDPHFVAFSKDAIDEAELARHKVKARKEAETELSAQIKLLDECEALLNETVEADKYVSSLSLELEEATWACDKAKGKLEATLDEVKEADNEISARSKSLGECAALLNKAAEAVTYVDSLSHELEEATLAYDTATRRLEATLEKVAV